MSTPDRHQGVARVTEALRAAGVRGEVVELDGSARTAQHAADALGVEIGAIANSLVFLLDGTPVLVLTSGAHRVDEAWLGGRLGGVLRRAGADAVRAATGQPIGGVAPVGHPAPLRTLVDTALRTYPAVWAAAGHPRTVFPTTFDELVSVTGGTASDVTPG